MNRATRDERIERAVLAADDTHGAVAAAGWLAQRSRLRPISVEIVVVEGGVRAAPPGRPAHQSAEGVAWGMREYLAARTPGTPLSVAVLEGPVLEAVHAAAARGDLLVLGCNRGGAMGRLPIASRSTRLAEAAVRPTVLVPATWQPHVGPVVAAVGTNGGDAVVDWAAAEAAGSGSELLLVRGNLLPWLAAAPSGAILDAAILDDVDARLLGRAVARARAAHPDLVVHARLDHVGIVPELVAEGARAALLVLGTGSGPAFGSVLRGVLEQAPCPVAVVPAAQAR